MVRVKWKYGHVALQTSIGEKLFINEGIFFGGYLDLSPTELCRNYWRSAALPFGQHMAILKLEANAEVLDL